MEPNLSTESLLQEIGLLHMKDIHQQRLLSQQFSMLQGKDKEIAKLKEDLAVAYKQLTLNAPKTE